MIQPLRFVLYCMLFIFAVITLALSAVRIHYTTTISPQDPTNHGVRFHDPVVAELLATSILTILWATLSMILNCLDHSLFVVERIGLFVLFLLWLVGAAIATHTSNPPKIHVYWGNLSSCWVYWQCRHLTAMLAFAWLAWIVVFVLLLTLLFMDARTKNRRNSVARQSGPTKVVDTEKYGDSRPAHRYPIQDVERDHLPPVRSSPVEIVSAEKYDEAPPVHESPTEIPSPVEEYDDSPRVHDTPIPVADGKKCDYCGKMDCPKDPDRH